MLLDSITCQHQTGNHTSFEFHIGDILEISLQTPNDLLVISAFPNDYSVSNKSVIAQLHKRFHISVRKLALDKELDLRKRWQCWISKPFKHHIGTEAFEKRIVCFENAFNQVDADDEEDDMTLKIANIYRSISEFILWYKPQNETIDSITIPIVASGDQLGDWKKNLEAIVEEAYLKISNETEFPVKKIRVVLWEQSSHLHHLICESGRLLERFLHTQVKLPVHYAYDLFISYSHKNQKIVFDFLEQLKIKKPNLKIYIDQEQLYIGMVWKKELLRAIHSSRFFFSFVSANYLSSDHCSDELNAARCRHLKNSKYIFPFLIEEIKNLPKHPILNIHSIPIKDAFSTKEIMDILDTL